MFIEKLSKEDITNIFQGFYGNVIVELNDVGTKSVEIFMKSYPDVQQPFIAFLKDFDINAESNTAFHNCHSRILPPQGRTINMWRKALYNRFGEEYKERLSEYLDAEKKSIMGCLNLNKEKDSEKTK